MIKNIFKIYVLVILALTFTNCDNHEFPKTPYPNVRTLTVTQISSSSAMFQAEVTNTENSSILSHGFVWSQYADRNPEIGPNDSISLGKLSSEGIFNYKLNSGLIVNKIYYVRGFVKTKDYIVFGEEVSFTSR